MKHKVLNINCYFAMLIFFAQLIQPGYAQSRRKRPLPTPPTSNIELPPQKRSRPLPPPPLPPREEERPLPPLPTPPPLPPRDEPAISSKNLTDYLRDLTDNLMELAVTLEQNAPPPQVEEVEETEQILPQPAPTTQEIEKSTEPSPSPTAETTPPPLPPREEETTTQAPQEQEQPSTTQEEVPPPPPLPTPTEKPIKIEPAPQAPQEMLGVQSSAIGNLQGAKAGQVGPQANAFIGLEQREPAPGDTKPRYRLIAWGPKLREDTLVNDFVSKVSLKTKEKTGEESFVTEMLLYPIEKAVELTRNEQGIITHLGPYDKFILVQNLTPFEFEHRINSFYDEFISAINNINENNYESSIAQLQQIITHNRDLESVNLPDGKQKIRGTIQKLLPLIAQKESECKQQSINKSALVTACNQLNNIKKQVENMQQQVNIKIKHNYEELVQKYSKIAQQEALAKAQSEMAQGKTQEMLKRIEQERLEQEKLKKVQEGTGATEEEWQD